MKWGRLCAVVNELATHQRLETAAAPVLQEGLQVIEAWAIWGNTSRPKYSRLQWRCMLVDGQELDSFNTQEILNVSATSFHTLSTTFLKLFPRKDAVLKARKRYV